MKRRAFTIVEIMLYVVLLATIVGTLMVFLLNILGRESKVMTIMDVNQNARFALEKMDATIRSSKDATVPTDGGGTGTTLSLIMPNAAVSPTVFAVSNGVLTMKQGTGAAVPITSAGVKVSNLTFTNLVDPSAHINTDPHWVPCTPQHYQGIWGDWWIGVCCWNHSDTKEDVCWDILTAIWHIWFIRDAKIGTCYVTSSAKSVIRMSVTVSAPPTVVPGNDFFSSITLYGSSTIPRQN